jgi:hypothetical protein
MSEDNQFVARGSNSGPTDVGFKTFSTTIVRGGQFDGTESGISATANLGRVPGAVAVGVAITAQGNVNDGGAVFVSNDAPRGWGGQCESDGFPHDGVEVVVLARELRNREMAVLFDDGCFRARTAE